jgi:hypothetical protein
METPDLIGKILRYEDGSSLTRDQILALLNEGQLNIAGGGDRPHGLPLVAPLPELASSATVTLLVNAESVALPATYHRHVFSIIDADDQPLEIVDTYFDLEDAYPTLTVGGTEVCFVRGNTLYYAPAKAQNVTVKFHRLPVDMTDDAGQEPDGIPAHLQERLFVSYALKEMEAQIERGSEEPKVNTTFWEGRYHQALTDLERFIGPIDQRPENVSDKTDYIYVY